MSAFSYATFSPWKFEAEKVARKKSGRPKWEMMRASKFGTKTGPPRPSRAPTRITLDLADGGKKGSIW